MQTNAMRDICEEISTRFVLESSRAPRADLAEIVIDHRRAKAALLWLKREAGYLHLTHFTVVDWIEKGQFQLSYLVTDPYKHHTLMVTTSIDRETATMESIHELWPEAVTYEQEINEMYGIAFPGSPRQGVEFLLEGWKDMPPMRRDFDTVAFCETHFDSRPGRSSVDPKEVRARFKIEREQATAANGQGAPR